MTVQKGGRRLPLMTEMNPAAALLASGKHADIEDLAFIHPQIAVAEQRHAGKRDRRNARTGQGDLPAPERDAHIPESEWSLLVANM